jgi:chromatin modification-related protein YNG2
VGTGSGDSVPGGISEPTSPDVNGHNGTPSSKAHLVPRIAAGYGELERLGREKVALANRIVVLIGRVRTRLEGDLGRVGVLQGEVVPSGSVGSEVHVVHGRNPVTAISESLRNALGEGPAQKSELSLVLKSWVLMIVERRLGVPKTQPRSRLSRQMAVESGEGEGEGEEDGEGEEGEEVEDQEIYCFCQKLSYGEVGGVVRYKRYTDWLQMIACDNALCAYQWFHLPCVNLKAPLPERWYCSECSSSNSRKQGRKK